MAVGNDTRGWIMACVSGIACVIGASVICIDLLIQLIPRFKKFRIQDSDTFLSSSLSLSFGVMLYSALYNMLPSAKDYLIKGGFSPSAASWTLIGCFLGGVIGIQIVSRLLHHYIPSHVVDCDHTHDDPDSEHEISHHSHDTADHSHSAANGSAQIQDSEDTPLLSRDDYDCKPAKKSSACLAPEDNQYPQEAMREAGSESRRASLQRTLSRRMSSFVTMAKAHCDEGGPCHGYSDPCGQECFKAITRSHSGAFPRRSVSGPIRPLFYQSTIREVNESGTASSDSREDLEPTDQNSQITRGRSTRRQSHDMENGRDSFVSGDTESFGPHHHHVPSNAFLSIGLQTSIAIALHKLPEGFITYATNHANPKLGFTVFMALFIHNITEGFAMALPLYLAIGSRTKAMLWSSLLGGISQPLGAGIAALWFHAAKSSDMMPSEGVYGGMFAITSGIMTSVALQLFSESLGLTHNKNLCVMFAFIGIAILGVSNALTA